MNQFGVVLLVSERSGSNLLRTLLGNHSQITAPVAPHLLTEFYHIRKYYGDLRENINNEKLINDMISLANHPYHNWQLNCKFVADDNINKYSSIVSAMDFVYKKKAVQEKKLHYCSKGIHSFSFIDQIRAEVPSIKFVHLVRDPRDHVASWMKKPIALLTPYDAILKWKQEQDIFIDAVQSRRLDYISIRYEDLISDTEKTMTSLLNYLALPIDEACFSTNTEKNKEVKWNPYWENLSKPIMSENKNKFKTELSEEDINLIETIAKNEMTFFNYEPVSSQNWQPQINFEKKLMKQRVEKAKTLKQKPFLELESKWNYIENIREVRRKEWEKSHYKIYIENNKQNNTTKTSIKTRFKYLSFAVLGEDISKKIIRKLR